MDDDEGRNQISDKEKSYSKLYKYLIKSTLLLLGLATLLVPFVIYQFHLRRDSALPGFNDLEDMIIVGIVGFSTGGFLSLISGRDKIWDIVFLVLMIIILGYAIVTNSRPYFGT